MSAERPEDVSKIKTRLFIVIAALSNSFGNLLLAIAMEHMPSFSNTGFLHYAERLVANPFLVPGTLLTVVYMLSQLSLFSWADLSYVVPSVASSYIVTTLLSEFVLGEHVHLLRWVGVGLISIGVLLVSETPSATAPAIAAREKAHT